jgi:transcriptional regulator with XRE-family HTH domain
MTTSERIRQARKTLKMSQPDFAKAIFISKGYIAELECNHRRANDRIIHLISLTFGISEKWLKTGEGEMFYKSPDEKFRRMTALFNLLPPNFQDYVLSQVEQLLNVTKKDAPPD